MVRGSKLLRLKCETIGHQKPRRSALPSEGHGYAVIRGTGTASSLPSARRTLDCSRPSVVGALLLQPERRVHGADISGHRMHGGG